MFASAIEELGLDRDAADLLVDVATVLRAAGSDHFGAGELGDLMVCADRIRARVEGQTCGLTARFGAGTDWAFDGARSPAGWLTAHTGVSRTNGGSRVKQAMVLVECPHIVTLAKAGRLSPDKVRALLAVRIPALVRVFTEQEHKLATTVAGLSVAGAQIYLQRWMLAAFEQLQTNPDEPFDEHRDANTFRLSPILGGRHVANGEFDATSSATIQNAVDALIKAWQRDGVLDGDARTLVELQGDALTELIERGAGHLLPNRPSVLALIDIDTLMRGSNDGKLTDLDPTGFRSDLAGHGPVEPEIIRRMCCNADITRVVTRGPSEILDVGRSQRLATPAIRKAVWARSGGYCEICSQIRLTWCQLHHIDWWRNGGVTSVENSLLVCNHCHKTIHDRRHTVHREPDGTYRLLKPDGTPLRRPLGHRPPHGRPPEPPNDPDPPDD